MKKYLKTFAAVLMAFSGAMATSKFFTSPISYTILLIACWRLWETGESFELYKFWDELELLKYKEENNEKIS